MREISLKLLLIYLYSTINLTCSQDDYQDIIDKEAFDWCCLKCDGPHVMCPQAVAKRNLSRPEGCSTIRKKGTVESYFSQDNLMALINDRRSKLAENADISNMNYLQIDDELTTFAEHLAGYCNSIPSVCVDTDDFEVKVLTFNVTGDHANVTMTMVVDYWMNGRNTYLKKYHDALYTNYTSIKETDDFTLLMWSTTAEIGCAEAYYYSTPTASSYYDNSTSAYKTSSSAYYDNSTFSSAYSYNSTSSYYDNGTSSDVYNNTAPQYRDTTDAPLSYQIICLLGPAGNINGAPMWERGPPCTNCSGEPSESYCRQSLCYYQFPHWPRDEERLASCKSVYPPADDTDVFVRDGERPYAKGVTVILKPRYICDPIAAAETPMSLRWFILVATGLSLRA